MTADPAQCSFQFNPTGTSKFTSSCDVTKATLARSSATYTTEAAAAGSVTKIRIGETEIQSFEVGKLTGDDVKSVPAAFTKSVNDALQKAGYPGATNTSIVKIPIEPKEGLWNFVKMFDIFSTQKLTIIAVLTILVLYVTAVYGPIAAALGRTMEGK